MKSVPPYFKRFARSIGLSRLYWLGYKTQNYWRWLLYRRLSSRIIRSYIQQHRQSGSEIRLQIGAGGKILPGWLNTDYDRHPNCVFLDATQPLPFADSEVSLILVEHVIANLSKAGGLIFFRESYRCLKPSGILRLSTPNLTALSQALISDNMEDTKIVLLNRHRRLYRQGEEISFCDLVNDIHYLWGHKYLYTEEELNRQLRAAGFTQIKRASFGQSRDTRLVGVDQHQASPEMAYIDLIVEAIR